MPFQASDAESTSPRPADAGTGARHLAPDCAGLDFFALDRSVQDLLAIYLPAAEHRHLLPHFRRLGQLAGGRLSALAAVAAGHGPVLHARTRLGEDHDWIEYHPAWQEMEHIARGDFQLHAMSHRAGVLGWGAPFSPAARYAFQYLFAQSGAARMCAVGATDAAIHLIRGFGSPALQQWLLPRMLATDPAVLWKGTIEMAGGPDAGAIEAVAREAGGQWRLYGEKGFCPPADADVALLLARPEGVPAGTRGSGLFALPRRLEDGSRNACRIVRLGGSVAGGEVRLEGALAYPVGALDQGLGPVMEQLAGLSRMSHAVRAAGMMRRGLNEALQAARHRGAFGGEVIGDPLLRRQLLKLMVPTEAALSMVMATADAMRRAGGGDGGARQALRLLMPLIRVRAGRDHVAVAAGAMAVRGGGHVEDAVGAWPEGTGNIDALDAIRQAVGKARAHHALQALLATRLEQADMPAPLRQALWQAWQRAAALAGTAAADGAREADTRRAASALYHASTAILMGWEASQPGADARRLLLAHALLRHRLLPADPPAATDMAGLADLADSACGDLLLGDAPVTLGHASAAIALAG